MSERTDFTDTVATTDHFTENEHGVTLADLKTTIATLEALADHYFADGERLPQTPRALAGTLQAYEVSTSWSIRVGMDDAVRNVRVTIPELCACTPARKYQQTGWELVDWEWSEDGAVLTFELPESGDDS